MTDFFICIFFISVFSLSVDAKKIETSHQKCEVDNDCQPLTIACACIHNITCARPEDKEKAYIDVVNKKFADKYESLAKCTAEETRTCSMAGACPMIGTWIAKCENKKCTLTFKSTN